MCVCVFVSARESVDWNVAWDVSSNDCFERLWPCSFRLGCSREHYFKAVLASIGSPEILQTRFFMVRFLSSVRRAHLLISKFEVFRKVGGREKGQKNGIDQIERAEEKNEASSLALDAVRGVVIVAC